MHPSAGYYEPDYSQQPYSPQRTIGMAPHPLQRDRGAFNIETPSADPLWLNRQMDAIQSAWYTLANRQVSVLAL